MIQFLADYGWFLIAGLAMLSAWLDGHNRASKRHIETLEKHVAWLKATFPEASPTPTPKD